MSSEKRILLRNLVLAAPIMFLQPNSRGLIISLLAFGFLTKAIPWLQARDEKRRKQVSDSQLGEFIESYLLATSAGLTPLSSLALAADFCQGNLKQILNDVVSRCRLGIDLKHSLAIAVTENPELASISRLIMLTQTSGAGIHKSLELELDLLHSKVTSQKLKRVKSLPIKCVFPLGLCFLPAFFLLTVIPLVASLLPKVFPDWH